MVRPSEQQARKIIDSPPIQAGWRVCDASQVNIHAACGVEIWEFLLPGHGSIESSDMVVTDECRHSICNLWAQVLEYFNAYLIGLTATPSKQTFGFTLQKLVMDYSYEMAVADGVTILPRATAEQDVRAKKHAHAENIVELLRANDELLQIGSNNRATGGHA